MHGRQSMISRISVKEDKCIFLHQLFSPQSCFDYTQTRSTEEKTLNEEQPPETLLERRLSAPILKQNNWIQLFPGDGIPFQLDSDAQRKVNKSTLYA